MFTMKSSLEAIIKSSESEKTDDASAPQRTSLRNRCATSSSSAILPTVCIFCEKDTKFMKKSKTREKLIRNCELRADVAVRGAAKQRNDQRMLPVTANELHASEAFYHQSCYRNYTRVLYKLPNINDDASPAEDPREISFNKAKDYVYQKFKEQQTVEFSTVRSKMLNELELLNVDTATIQTALHNLKRSFERHCADVRFTKDANGKLLLFNKDRDIETLITTSHNTERELNAMIRSSDEEKQIISAAHTIRKEILSMEDTLPWPPREQDLIPESVRINKGLCLFLTVLLTGSQKESISPRANRLRSSYAQDIIYGVSKGKCKTPKSILLPSCVKSLTNSTEVINILCKYGHGVSYTLLEELETEYAISLIEDAQSNPENVFVPVEFSAENEIVTVWDNIDDLEETLSGSGTSHRCNGIGVQLKTPATQVLIRGEPKSKRCRRSLPSGYFGALEPYVQSKREGPGKLTFPDESSSNLLKSQSMKYLLWSFARCLNLPRQVVPSWTGFFITVRNNILILESTVGYFESINAPTTEMSTVFEILKRSCRIMEKLKLPSIVCVFDQAIYSKACEIVWKKKAMFQDVVLMLGNFHLMMMYLGVIGKRFGDAGLRDVMIQSDVISQGSVDKALTGHMYNRAVRMHKLMYESLMRILCNELKAGATGDNDIENDSCLHQFDEMLQRMVNGLDQESFEKTLESTLYKSIQHRFNDHKKEICKGDLQKFWFSYLNMVELLLNLIYAQRAGDWILHLECVKKVVPWAFAYDRHNYARYLQPYLSDMLNLPTTHPEIHDYFSRGHFAVQLSRNNPFGKIDADKTIENTINKDTKTPGGINRFSLNDSAVQRWTLNSRRRAIFRAFLHNHLHYKPSSFIHVIHLLPSRIKKDNDAVSKITENLEEIFVNPFSEQRDLISITSGLAATPTIRDHLLNAITYGQDVMELFRSERLGADSIKEFFNPLKRQNLQTFSTLRPKKVLKVNQKEVVLKADRELFGDEFGMLRKTNKAAITTALEKNIEYVESVPQNSATLLDGMAVVQKLKIDQSNTFGDIAEKFSASISQAGFASKRIDVVFDVYIENSIKNAERVRRGTSSLQFGTLLNNSKVKQWKNFLSSSTGNKSRIISIDDVSSQANIQANKLGVSNGEYKRSLLGVYCFTGCDTVSAFAGKGKLKALKLLQEEREFVAAFSRLGLSWDVDNNLVNELQKFVCRLYGQSTVNELRYKMYCSKNGKVKSEQLPPCHNALKQHILRCNYQARIWRLAFENNPVYPEIHEHGWYLENQAIKIRWMTCQPAPNEVLSLLSCSCKRTCQPTKCSCIDNRMHCTDLCSCGECQHKFLATTESSDSGGESDSDFEDIE
ncbi:hypothetical protein GQR58_027743 [Nymphon striatum]|nr:hypothetical protein GQR58_027743 [Nymphon striatum]